MRAGLVSIMVVLSALTVVSFGSQWEPFGGPYCARSIVDIAYGPGNPNVIY